MQLPVRAKIFRCAMRQLLPDFGIVSVERKQIDQRCLREPVLIALDAALAQPRKHRPIQITHPRARRDATIFFQRVQLQHAPQRNRGQEHVALIAAQQLRHPIEVRSEIRAACGDAGGERIGQRQPLTRIERGLHDSGQPIESRLIEPPAVVAASAAIRHQPRRATFDRVERNLHRRLCQHHTLLARTVDHAVTHADRHIPQLTRCGLRPDRQESLLRQRHRGCLRTAVDFHVDQRRSRLFGKRLQDAGEFGPTRRAPQRHNQVAHIRRSAGVSVQVLADAVAKRRLADETLEHAEHTGAF